MNSFGSFSRILLAAICLDYFQLATAKSFTHSLTNQTRFKRFSCNADDFMCGNTECIYKELQCDGTPDCTDNTDESPVLCSTFVSRSVGCSAPPPLPGGQFVVSGCDLNNASENCIPRTNLTLPVGSLLNLRCTHGFSLDTENNEISCTLQHTWSPSVLPTCKKTCPPLVTPNLLAKCSILAEDKNGLTYTKHVLCDEPVLDQTKAVVTCPEFYKSATNQETDVLYCRNGRWDDDGKIDCKPRCGSGSVVNPLIFHGTHAQQKDFPWHVGIYWREPLGSKSGKFAYQCGGTLISPFTVLTAAHCRFVNDSLTSPVPLSDVRVGVGKEESAWEKTPLNQRFTISQFLTPAEYSGRRGFYNHDVAVIVLSSPVTLSESLYPVCLDENPDRFGEGSKGKMAGWGMSDTNNISEKLQYAEIPFVSRAKCLSKMTAEEGWALTFDKFCGGTLTEGPQAKRGDSGGGLVYQDNNITFVAGIVSTRLKKPNFWISLYTKVTNHVDWIKKKMKE